VLIWVAVPYSLSSSLRPPSSVLPHPNLQTQQHSRLADTDEAFTGDSGDGNLTAEEAPFVDDAACRQSQVLVNPNR